MIKVLLQSQAGIKREHSNVEDERKGNSLESFHQDDRILPSSFHGGQTTPQRRLHRLLSRVRQQARLMSWLKTPCLFQSHFRKSFPPAHFFLPLVGLEGFRTQVTRSLRKFCSCSGDVGPSRSHLYSQKEGLPDE